MKLVIDIPDKGYRTLQVMSGGLGYYHKIILKGTPLNEVRDQIKQEINELPDLNPDGEMDKSIHVSKWATFDIIDKNLT